MLRQLPLALAVTPTPNRDELRASRSDDCVERQMELTLRPAETYRFADAGRVVTRTVRWSSGSQSSKLTVPAGLEFKDAASAWDAAWLRQRKQPGSKKQDVVRIADVFSGCGQMSVGVAEAARALGLRGELVLAVDLDPNAIEVCRRLFPGCDGKTTPLESLLDRNIGERKSAAERRFVRNSGEIDLLVGGPPCQGHSDFNNHTRRSDERNALALKMVRFAELASPRHIVLENVRGIIHDQRGVFQTVREELERLGYRTAQRLLAAESHGVPQLRRRMFLVATLAPHADPNAALELPVTEPRSFAWACSDLKAVPPEVSDDIFDAPPIPTARNQKRIDYLFDHRLWDLPDSERPPCHQNGEHSYKSVYGRIWWDRPVQTITTGFRCMGQGRFVHPHHRRTITPHEAARLQFIPDFVDFSGIKSTSLAKLIGNAVPPKLAYGIALALLASERC